MMAGNKEPRWHRAERRDRTQQDQQQLIALVRTLLAEVRDLRREIKEGRR